MRVVMLTLPLGLLLVGCPQGEDTVSDGNETGEDTASGGGDEDNWRATGSGFAYFTDGEEDNSLFRLELSRALPPREGEAYYGFVSSPTSGLVALGEISVNGEDVDFSADIGENAIVGGYNHFEAWQSGGDGTSPEGDALWEGDVDATVYDVIQRLLIANPETPSGEGSLRALETQLEFLRDEATAAATGGLSLTELQLVGEKIGNALEDPTEDANNDGDDDVYDDNFAVMADDEKGDAGYVELIFADFRVAVDALDLTDPDHNDPIRDYIEQAYDGPEFVEYQVSTFAAPKARSAADDTSTSLAEQSLTVVAEDMANYLTGFDADEDGTVEDIEIGIETSIDLVSLMVQMPVNVAN